MKNSRQDTIVAIVLATGISSVVTQLLTIRELLSQFNGNEIVIALILFSWLVLGGIGTAMARWTVRAPHRSALQPLIWLSLAIAALPPLQILAIRRLRDLVFIHGASVGFYATFLFVATVILPYALLIGFVLPYSLFVLRGGDPHYPGTRIYILDNLGDIAGGALFSFVLVFWLTPLWTLCWVNLPLVLICSLAARYVPSKAATCRIWMGAAAAVLMLFAGGAMETASLQPREGRLVDYIESRYGRITVHADHQQVTLFSDGRPQFSSHHPAAAEETVHYALAQLQTVERILLLSAEGGVMREIQKYHPVRVDYVELNPAVTRTLMDHGLIDPFAALNVVHTDGRAFLAATDARYDAVIVNLPEPDNFQINRFYTTQFFELVHRHLSAGGVFSFFMAGYDNYLAEPQRQKLSSLYNGAAAVFSNVVLLPGQKICFLCSDQPIRTDIPALLARKNIATEYIRGYYDGNVSTERIRELNNLIDPAAPLNTDLAPFLMRIMFTQWFAKYATSPHLFLGCLVLLGIGYLIRVNREEFVLFTTGWTTMGSEILVIFAFQVFFGYIYFQIGLIVTVFLAGLLPGAALGRRRVARSRRWLRISDGALIGLMGCFVLLLQTVGTGLPRSFYLLFGFTAALACGFQFPLALALHGDSNPSATRFFSADLVGAAAGSLFTSIVFIPYVGITGAALMLITIKTASLLVAGIAHENIHPPRHSVG